MSQGFYYDYCQYCKDNDYDYKVGYQCYYFGGWFYFFFDQFIQ